MEKTSGKGYRQVCLMSTCSQPMAYHKLTRTQCGFIAYHSPNMPACHIPLMLTVCVPQGPRTLPPQPLGLLQ